MKQRIDEKGEALFNSEFKEETKEALSTIERVFGRTSGGIQSRIECPQCGSWIDFYYSLYWGVEWMECSTPKCITYRILVELFETPKPKPKPRLVKRREPLQFVKGRQLEF